MNNDRRKRIDAILEDLAKLTAAIDALPDSGDISSAIEEIAGEEREYYDNMHENLQGGERGEIAEQAASNMEEAQGEMDELGVSELSDKLAEIVAKLEAARDGG